MVWRLYDWSFEATERNVSDSLLLRQFARLYLEAAPDDTTLIRWAKLIGADTLECLNEPAVTLALERKVTREHDEKQRCFRRGFRFRAGIEGRISVLDRAFGLNVCLHHGEEGMGRWVGWSNWPTT